MKTLNALIVTRKKGSEPFEANMQHLKFNLKDFWQWSFSDLTSNVLRGMLAEYIVATAVNATAETREEWAAFDVVTPEGIKLEVKSAAYIQSWSQKKYSAIRFSISEKMSWEASSNIFAGNKKRSSDIYVFCVLREKDKATINPLNLDQWDFYIISTADININIGSQKNISLSRLLKLNPVKSSYYQLYHNIKVVFNAEIKSDDRVY